MTGLDFSADGAYALAAIAGIEGDDSSNGRLVWLDMAQVSILATRYAQSLSAITAVDYGGPTRADPGAPLLYGLRLR